MSEYGKTNREYEPAGFTPFFPVCLGSYGHAEKCPVCNGTGQVKKAPIGGGACRATSCHGCDGKGWITVY